MKSHLGLYWKIPNAQTHYKEIMVSILVSSNNELHLSILEALLITRFKHEHCKQKQFYILVLFCKPLSTRKLISAVPTLLACFFIFFLPTLCLLRAKTLVLNSSNTNSTITSFFFLFFLLRHRRNKGSLF